MSLTLRLVLLAFFVSFGNTIRLEKTESQVFRDSFNRNMP